MRPIHLVQVDKWRPAVILTRENSRDHMQHVTVAPITSRIHGLPVEVPVGPDNGLDVLSVVSADGIDTVARHQIGRQIGWLLDEQEDALAQAIAYAFDLELDASPHRTLRARFRSHPAPRSD